MLGLDVVDKNNGDVKKDSSFKNDGSGQAESNTEHIWQLNDLDTNLVSIYCINRNAIKNSILFKSFVSEAEKQTGCIINVYGLENNAEVIWIKIKNSSLDSRESAFDLINAITKNSCKEIVLPKLSDLTHSSHNNQSYKRKTVCVVDTPSFFNTKTSNINSKNHDEFVDKKQALNNHKKSNKKRPLVRSKTENSVSFLTDQIENLNLNNSYKLDMTKKKRYTLDFLLSRSDMPQSKQMPHNWKELNELYPNVCFNDNVTSFFNPHKYSSHWNKVKLQNSDIHSESNYKNATIHQSKSFHHYGKPSSSSCYSSTSSTISSISSSSSTTDDFLNLKSTFNSYFNNQKQQLARFGLDNNNDNNFNKRNSFINTNAQNKKLEKNNQQSIVNNIKTNRTCLLSNNNVNQSFYSNNTATPSDVNSYGSSAFKYHRKNVKFSNGF